MLQTTLSKTRIYSSTSWYWVMCVEVQAYPGVWAIFRLYFQISLIIEDSYSLNFIIATYLEPFNRKKTTCANCHTNIKTGINQFLSCNYSNYFIHIVIVLLCVVTFLVLWEKKHDISFRKQGVCVQYFHLDSFIIVQCS